MQMQLRPNVPKYQLPKYNNLATAVYSGKEETKSQSLS